MRRTRYGYGTATALCNESSTLPIRLIPSNNIGQLWMLNYFVEGEWFPHCCSTYSIDGDVRIRGWMDGLGQVADCAD